MSKRFVKSSINTAITSINACTSPSLRSSGANSRYNQAVGLFADSPDADVKVFFHGGIWYGKEGARRLYIERFQKTFTHGRNGPRHGFLLDHPMYQDVVDVSEDGKTAKGRFRCNMQAGLHESQWPKDPNAKFLAQWWEGMDYLVGVC